jgi:hypothetical protein
MSSALALIILLLFIFFVVSVGALCFHKARRFAKWTAPTSLVAMITAFIVFGVVTDNEKHAAHQATATAIASAKQNDQKEGEATDNRPDAIPKEKTAVGRGRAQICATTDIKFDTFNEISLPATTVFKDFGRLSGDIRDGSQFTGESKFAGFITTDPVVLTRQQPCAEAWVRMLIGPLYAEPYASVSERHRWVIDDVLDYPIPARKPAIEIGQLINDVSIVAVLLTDIGDPLTLPQHETDESGGATRCLAEAQKIAAHESATIGRQTRSAVFIHHPAAAEMSFGCAEYSLKPDLYIAWDRQPRPPAATVKLIASAGEFLTGATSEEMKQELAKCVAAALSPNSGELADRQFRGVKMECQAFTRDGGGGSVTVYRRFGAYPTHDPPTAEVQAEMERASAALKAEQDTDAIKSLEFAKWWLDPQIPPKIKTFIMIVARIHALAERCPTWKPNYKRIEEAAAYAGIVKPDIEPGGRYYKPLLEVMTAMRRGTQTESIEDACDAARRNYGEAAR